MASLLLFRRERADETYTRRKQQNLGKGIPQYSKFKCRDVSKSAGVVPWVKGTGTLNLRSHGIGRSKPELPTDAGYGGNYKARDGKHRNRNEIAPVKLTFHDFPQRIPRNKEENNNA